MRMTGQLTRREFLIIGGTVAAGTLTAGPFAAVPAQQAPQGLPGGVRTAFKLSVRGRRGSNAAKLHNANWVFATFEAADQHRAHPGDHSRVVEIPVSADEFDRLFTSRNRDMADLRQIGGPTLLGDCNRNKQVTVDEVIRGVNIALGNSPVSECLPFDRSGDGEVRIPELIAGVNNALAS
jgi:hypothetical protein